MVTFILWDANPELFSLGQFTLRWNAMLVIIAYLAGRRLLVYIYKHDGNPAKNVDANIAYLLISALVGARLFHVILYQHELFLTGPLEVIFPFEFEPTFHATDSLGFSVHGALLGILLGAFLYTRKSGQSFYYILSRASIVVALAGFFLFLASFLNSDIDTKPTASATGIVFLPPVTQGLQKLPCCVMRNPNGENPLESVIVKEDKDQTLAKEKSHLGILMYLFFKPGATEQLVGEFLIGDVKTFLFDMSKTVYEPGTEPLHFTIIVAKDGNYIGRVKTVGIARHPVLLIEAIFCFFLFAWMMWYWKKYKTNAADASLLGYCMILFWSSHLLLSFQLETQSKIATSFDIIFILSGIIVIILSLRSGGSSRQRVKPDGVMF